jgi:hypothetical protein
VPALFELPEAGDRERKEYCGQRAGDAQFQGNRQWVSEQLTPAANRAAAAAGMSSSAKTRCRSGSTAQVNGLMRVMTASQSHTDQTHLCAIWPSVTLPRRRPDRRAFALVVSGTSYGVWRSARCGAGASELPAEEGCGPLGYLLDVLAHHLLLANRVTQPARSYSTVMTTLPLACPSPRYRSASGTSLNR